MTYNEKNETQIKRRNQIMKKNENKGKKQIMKKEKEGRHNEN